MTMPMGPGEPPKKRYQQRVAERANALIMSPEFQAAAQEAQSRGQTINMAEVVREASTQLQFEDAQQTGETPQGGDIPLGRGAVDVARSFASGAIAPAAMVEHGKNAWTGSTNSPVANMQRRLEPQAYGTPEDYWHGIPTNPRDLLNVAAQTGGEFLSLGKVLGKGAELAQKIPGVSRVGDALARVAGRRGLAGPMAQATVQALPAQVGSNLAFQGATDPQSLTTPEGLGMGTGFGVLGALMAGKAAMGRPRSAMNNPQYDGQAGPLNERSPMQQSGPLIQADQQLQSGAPRDFPMERPRTGVPDMGMQRNPGPQGMASRVNETPGMMASDWVPRVEPRRLAVVDPLTGEQIVNNLPDATSMNLGQQDAILRRQPAPQPGAPVDAMRPSSMDPASNFADLRGPMPVNPMMARMAGNQPPSDPSAARGASGVSPTPLPIEPNPVQLPEPVAPQTPVVPAKAGFVPKVKPTVAMKPKIVQTSVGPTEVPVTPKPKKAAPTASAKEVALLEAVPEANGRGRIVDGEPEFLMTRKQGGNLGEIMWVRNPHFKEKVKAPSASKEEPAPEAGHKSRPVKRVLTPTQSKPEVKSESKSKGTARLIPKKRTKLTEQGDD